MHLLELTDYCCSRRTLAIIDGDTQQLMKLIVLDSDILKIWKSREARVVAHGREDVAGLDGHWIGISIYE